MKLIIAIIRPESVDTVREKLYDKEITRITITDVKGHGRQMGRTEVYRGREYQVFFIDKVRLEIAVNEEFVDIAIDAIIEGARNNGKGAIGDGKIFVLPLERTIRIRTGETGGEAI